MIINFSIKNYKSIKDEITLSFEATRSTDLEDYYVCEPKKGLRLLKLGIIYGANASGKTNILEALNSLRVMTVEPFHDKTTKFLVEPFLFDENTQKENTVFSLEFIQNKIRYHYKIEFNKDAIISEDLYFFEPNKALLYSRKTDIEKQLTTIKFGGKIKISRESKAVLEGNTLWNNTVIAGYLKTNIELTELHEIMRWFHETLQYMIKPKTDLSHFISKEIVNGTLQKEVLLGILSRADFRISDIHFKKKEIALTSEELTLIAHMPDRVEEVAANVTKNGTFEDIQILFQHSINQKKHTLPYEDESAGTQRYYQLAGVLSFMISDSLIVPIDELESSLHPELFKHFLLTFLVNAKESQLIATTHHRELLLEKDILREDVIWFAEKKEDSATDLFSLSDFDSSIIRNTTSFYNKYKVGKLGAIPNLGDYYIEVGNE